MWPELSPLSRDSVCITWPVFFSTFTMSVHKKLQSNLSSRLAGYTQHIYMNFLFYNIDYIYEKWKIIKLK